MEDFFSKLKITLLNNHDIFYIRGKKGQAVPFLVPQDMKNVMKKFVEDSLKIGSQYLFAFPKDSSKVGIRTAHSLDIYVAKVRCE